MSARKYAPYGAFVAFYLALDFLFSYATVHEGLVSPRGLPHFGVICLGIVVLCARVIVRFVFPCLLIYRLLGSRFLPKLHSMHRARTMPDPKG